MATGALPLSNTGPALLRAVTPAALTAHLQAQDRKEDAPVNDVAMTELAGHVRTEWEVMRNHRNSAAGWNERLLHAQRVFNGQYDAQKLAEIQQFGGSDVYARVIALKCRGASALLREVFLGVDRPWGLDPTPEPALPENVFDTVQQLVGMEMQNAMSQGQPIDLNTVRDRTNALLRAARRAARKRAKDEAKAAEDKLDDYLVEGGFYEALTEFITDLPLFPFACLKGPVVRVTPDVVWQQGQATQIQKAKMFWERKSPFDIYWSPGASSIRDAAVIEKLRLMRADLNDLLGLPGYNEEAIRAVLDDYGRGGLRDWADSTDQERSVTESRESPAFNRSAMIDCLEYHGNVQGRALREYGFSEDEVPDELRDYFVQVWLIGRHVIKAQISPNPRKRHPYYITSFERVPGTPVGNALPDILSDIQDVCNAALRSLVNNLSIASGPQVVIDEERLSPLENADELYPWKRWRTKSDPMAPNQGSLKPVDFFSPQSNAAELLGVYKEFQAMADELSAIPRYITGSDKVGGVGRTASGLAMLMGNASKVLQMVASNVDHDVMRPLLTSLYDMVMLTDQSGMFKGDEAIRVRGVEVAVQRETTRQRSMEALQATANPLDAQIIGLPGRAKLLRSVLEQVAPDEDIVPPEDELMANAMGAAPPGHPGAPNPAMPPPALGGNASPQPGGPPTPGGSMPAPANTDLGVQDGKAMRGMAGPGAQHFAAGGLVQPVPKRGKRSIRVVRNPVSNEITGFELEQG